MIDLQSTVLSILTIDITLQLIDDRAWRERRVSRRQISKTQSEVLTRNKFSSILIPWTPPVMLISKQRQRRTRWWLRWCDLTLLLDRVEPNNRSSTLTNHKSLQSIPSPVWNQHQKSEESLLQSLRSLISMGGPTNLRSSPPKSWMGNKETQCSRLIESNNWNISERRRRRVAITEELSRWTRAWKVQWMVTSNDNEVRATAG